MQKTSENPIITIRKASKSDIPLLLDFIMGIADFEGLTDHVIATEENLEQSLFGDRPYVEAVIAEVLSESAGFLIFFHNFSSFVGKPGMFIEDIYVRPEFRGKGVDRALMVYCANVAKERNCGRLDWNVLDWNPAINFYEKLGAQSQDGWLLYRLDEKGIKQLAKKEI